MKNTRGRQDSTHPGGISTTSFGNSHIIHTYKHTSRAEKNIILMCMHVCVCVRECLFTEVRTIAVRLTNCRVSVDHRTSRLDLMSKIIKKDTEIPCVIYQLDECYKLRLLLNFSIFFFIFILLRTCVCVENLDKNRKSR